MFSDEDKFWKQRMELDKNMKELPVREKQCEDCPAMCMYRDITLSLAKQPVHRRAYIAKRWFCHGDNKACRGAWDVVMEDDLSGGPQ